MASRLASTIKVRPYLDFLLMSFLKWFTDTGTGKGDCSGPLVPSNLEGEYFIVGLSSLLVCEPVTVTTPLRVWLQEHGIRKREA